MRYVDHDQSYLSLQCAQSGLMKMSVAICIGCWFNIICHSDHHI